VRVLEQRQAAVVGEYGLMVQLGYPSRVVKAPGGGGLVEDLKKILLGNRMECVYTHNPADKHDTHIGVVVAVLDAVRGLPREQRPKKIYGCEVWRDLDWLGDTEKVVLDVSGRPNLAAALNGCFDSQITGGKRYDLGVIGRRSANATFFQSHASDAATQLTFAMDLTPLIEQEELDILEYVAGAVDRFKDDVLGRLRQRLGRKN
jgi:LmbE family N-acetylglucosaminyl deacetylase